MTATTSGQILHGDFETRSRADLKKTGVTGYAEDPSTDVWCLALAFDDEPPFLWTPADGPLPHRVVSHIEAGGEFWAHNVPFEIAIWNLVCVRRYGFPLLDVAQCYCTAVGCFSMGVPAALAKAAPALGLDVAKDLTGQKLMMQMAKPRRTTKKTKRPCDMNGQFCRRPDCSSCYGTGEVVLWWDEPDKQKRLGEYCIQDIEVERRLQKRVFPISESERRVWLLDQRINARGIMLDVTSAKAAMRLVEDEKRRLDAEMKRVTSDKVEGCSKRQQLANWLAENGVDVESLAKQDVVELLAAADELEPTHVAALKLRQEASKSSTAKLKAMILGACKDGKLRDLYQYHGAATGRWAGRRVQPHNLPRQKPQSFVFEVLNNIAA